MAVPPHLVAVARGVEVEMMDELTLEQMADEAIVERDAGLTIPIEDVLGIPYEKKLSGAARKRAWVSRERTQDKHGVWCLPKDETLWKGLRGKVK